MLATKTPELCFSKRRLSDLAIRTRGFLSTIVNSTITILDKI